MSATTSTREGLTIRRAEPVMGTIVSLDVRPHGLPGADARRALQSACDLLHAADATFSLYRPDSPMSRLRRGEPPAADVRAELTEIVELCARARALSGGWFDPWALPGGFDPTGLVKGWAGQRALEALRDAGVGAAMVNAAGDIAVYGRPDRDRDWRVGIRSPTATDELIAVVTPSGGAVASSGQYERGPHVLHPRTGRPADAALAATVCGPELWLADALATGLLAAGPAGLGPVRAAGYEALLVLPDGTLTASDGFPAAG